MSEVRSRERLSLAIEHLREAIGYSRRGRPTFLDPEDPDTRRLVEAELRKAFESLDRQGRAFYHANPSLDRARIAEIRQLLTHDYAEVGPEVLWKLVTDEAPRTLRRLIRARVPD